MSCVRWLLRAAFLRIDLAHHPRIGPFGELRAVVVNIDPRRLRSNEGVVRDPDARIAYDAFRLVAMAVDRRSAGRAKITKLLRTRFECGKTLGSFCDPEAFLVDHDVRHERCARR